MWFRFKDLSFRARMYTLVGTFLLGLMLTHIMYAIVICGVRIRSPMYDRIERRKDVTNDITPPAYHVIDSYLVVQQMIDTKDPIQRSKLVDRFRELRNQYQERHTHWLEVLTDPQFRRMTTVDAYQAAMDFYREVDERLIPALEANAATDQIQGRIDKFYGMHESTLARAAKRAHELIQADEEMANQTLASWIDIQIVVGLTVLSLLIVLSAVIIRGILGSTNLLLERVGEMAGGEADLTKRVAVQSRDEVGRLAQLINAVIQRIHDLIVRVRVATVQLNATASDIAASSAEQNNAVHSFNASTTQISAGVQEITATGQGLLATMEEVHTRACEASSLAGAGRAGLTGMEATMQQLADATGSISVKLGMIREKAGGINSVVTTITKVADQTNLLSINAAIEAEKAGEAGRGFLVVAREIRRLADQTAVATLDIDQMVRQMQAAVSAGVMEMDKFSEQVRTGIHQVIQISGQMGQIIEHVQSLSGGFDSVKEGMRQQTEGARQINEAMLQLTSGVRQVNASVQEFSSAAEHLRQAAQVLQNEVGHFTVSG